MVFEQADDGGLGKVARHAQIAGRVLPCTFKKPQNDTVPCSLGFRVSITTLSAVVDSPPDRLSASPETRPGPITLAGVFRS